MLYEIKNNALNYFENKCKNEYDIYIKRLDNAKIRLIKKKSI